MNAILGALRELWGLFVEDASFTLAICACLLLAVYAVPRAPMPASWRGIALFAFLAIALLENVIRSARR